MLFILALLQKMRTKKNPVSVGSCAAHGIDEVKAKNMPPFGQHSDKRTQTRYLLFTKHCEEHYPPDVRTGKISWEMEMKAISKGRRKIVVTRFTIH